VGTADCGGVSLPFLSVFEVMMELRLGGRLDDVPQAELLKMLLQVSIIALLLD
jgi:hypothetical protein